METKDLGTINTQLDQQHATLSAKAAGLRAELTTLDELLARIEAAKAALAGTTPCSTTAGLTKKGRRAASPSAGKAYVINLMERVLLQGKSFQESELKLRIEQMLIESGYSRNGFALRFKEACSDSRFEKRANGISLKQPSSAAVLSTNGHERINA